jgi:hypothetical protein
MLVKSPGGRRGKMRALNAWAFADYCHDPSTAISTGPSESDGWTR